MCTYIYIYICIYIYIYVYIEFIWMYSIWIRIHGIVMFFVDVWFEVTLLVLLKSVEALEDCSISPRNLFKVVECHQFAWLHVFHGWIPTYFRIPDALVKHGWSFASNGKLIYHSFGGFLSHGGIPSYHPFIDGMFHEINHPAIGVPRGWHIEGKHQMADMTRLRHPALAMWCYLNHLVYVLPILKE